MESPARVVLPILGIIVFTPSLAHAHGFPWWFGLMVLSPFLLLAALIAIPCKTWILRLTMPKRKPSLSFKGALVLMILDLGVLLFSSTYVHGIVINLTKHHLYDLIDSCFGWQFRAMFRGTFENLVGLLIGLAVTVFCAAILWFPHYLILKKKISEDSNPSGDARLLWMASLRLAFVAPGLFWIPASLRFM